MMNLNFYLLITTYFLAVLSNSKLFSQNLVPNSSFEIDSLKNTPIFNPYNNFTVAHWKTFPKGGADYFSSNRASGYSVPNNVFGTQPANDGNSYVGISLTSSGFTRFEYIQTKLITPLETNKYYCFSLYLSLSDNYLQSYNEIDFLISKTPSLENLNYKAIYSSKIVKSRNEWIKLSQIYKAKGNEEYLTIGMFNNSPKYSIKIKSGEYASSYYFLDNITLIKVEDTTNCLSKEKDDAKTNYDDALGKPLALKNINFEVNSKKILDSSYPELNNLVAYLKLHKNYKLQVSGHTDNSGDESSNLVLSTDRAKSIASFLISNGVSKELISFKGYGSSKPIKQNDTEENKLYNRRVEIILTK